MTETKSTPEHPVPPKKHIFDSFGCRFFFAAVSLSSPTPMAIVIVQLWLMLSGTGGDPMGYIRGAISGAGFLHLVPLIIALLPALLLITIIFRTKKARAIMFVLLFVAALAQFMALSQMGAS